MALINNTGKNPTGQSVPIPVPGLAQSTTMLLAANASWNTGILPYNGNEAVHFALSSDVGGTYSIEYYLNGQLISFTGNPTIYDPELVNSFQGALSGKGDSFKLIYTNGGVAQTRFYLEVRFGDDIQVTQRSIGVPVSATNMAIASHAVIEGREGATGAYKQATVSESSGKVAMDVKVINPSGAIDVSTLAKETGGNLAAILTKLGQSIAVTGTFYQATQPVSLASSPLPTGASTSALQTTGNTSLNNIDTDLGSPSDVAVVDPTQNASVIALLKGLLLETVAAGSTGTFTALSLAANVQQTIAANANRKMVVVSSVSGTILVGVGFTATATNYSYRLITNGTLEIPSSGSALSISFFATAASTVNVTQIV